MIALGVRLSWSDAAAISDLSGGDGRFKLNGCFGLFLEKQIIVIFSWQGDVK